MLLILRVMLIFLLPGIVMAQDYRPAETPPDDFSARQYIDSKGCVFLRDDETHGWTARVSRDGAPICGYPPTLSARGLDGKPRLTVLDPDAGRSPAELLEEALAETVLTNLRPGELASDPTPMEKLPDMGPEPGISSAPSDALKAALAAVPDMRRSMGAVLQPNKRLCELLGYDGTAGPAAADPSQGYCDSLPASDLSRLTFIRPVGSIPTADATTAEEGVLGTPAADARPAAVKPAAPAAISPAATKPAASKPVPRPSKSEVTELGKTSAPKARAASSPAATKVHPAPKAPAVGQTAKVPTAAAPAVVASVPSRPQPESASPAGGGLIPAAARYVQVGTYADAANADRAAKVVAAMGYAVFRGKDKVGTRDVQFIMAGPFNDRQSIVKALDGIRRAGFKDAYPR